MGVIDFLGKMIQGKPVFEDRPEKDGWDDDAPTVDYAEDRVAKREEERSSQSLLDENGNKVIPVAQVVGLRYLLNGTDKFDLWITVRNQSDRELHLDKIVLFNGRLDFNYALQPGQVREVKAYTGPLLTHDGYKKAELYYRDQATGDYFRADHMVDYGFEASTNTYEVQGLNLIQPIVDV